MNVRATVRENGGAGSLPMRIAKEDRQQEDVRGWSARRRRKWTFAYHQRFRRISSGVPQKPQEDRVLRKKKH